MNQIADRMLTLSAASFMALAAIAMPAYATDGVVLINQAAALSGNVTPGDAPGFPVEIRQPGSYRLTSNLTVPDVSTTAILIEADDVTLDLNGFSILGPNACVGAPAKCSQSGIGRGILAFGFGTDNLKVFNGSIRGMGSDGIVTIGTTLVEHVHAISNGGDGIAIGGRVNLSDASFNGGNGIIAATVTNSDANGNGGIGILVTGSAVNDSALQNGKQGIFAGCPALVVSSSGQLNLGGDIFTFGSDCVRANNVPAP